MAVSNCELVVNSVSCRYRGGHAPVSELSLAVAPGILGLRRPNGTGTSTPMRILATLMSGGQLRFHGTPGQLLARAEGHVGEWTLAAELLAEVRTRRVVCAGLHRPDGIRVRVVSSDSPHTDAQAVTPGLEDACAWLPGADAGRH